MSKSVIWGDELRADYSALFKACVVATSKLPIIDGIVLKLANNKSRYEPIAKQIGCPWWFVGMIHYIECGFRFDRHLHNGDPLTARTTHVPPGRPAVGDPPFDFENSALDALRLRKIDQVKDWSIAHVLYLLEGYNGYGYRQYHPGVNSPYLWSFTNQYKVGKYSADGKFDPKLVSQQAGLAGILKRAVEKGVIPPSA